MEHPHRAVQEAASGTNKVLTERVTLIGAIDGRSKATLINS
jgi:hypothetical protein